MVARAATGCPTRSAGSTGTPPTTATRPASPPSTPGIDRVPRAFTRGDVDRFSWDSAWWVYNFVSNLHLQHLFAHHARRGRSSEGRGRRHLRHAAGRGENGPASCTSRIPSWRKPVPDHLQREHGRGPAGALARTGRVHPHQVQRRLRANRGKSPRAWSIPRPGCAGSWPRSPSSSKLPGWGQDPE